MNNRDTDLEVLINRYLDGEISAREMEDLRNRVDSDGQAKDLFEQMQQLHRSCQEAIQTYVLQPGRPVEDLITTAWEGHNRGHVWAGRVRRRVVFSPFVSGLAAGLLVGVFIHLALTYSRPTPVRSPNLLSASSMSPRGTTANAATSEDTTQEEALPRVNLYYYTDSQGNRWVIEGLSEERVRNVAYYSGF
jgi:anti-sigma factor RsiW